MSSSPNPYLDQALDRLPQILAMFDTNPFSPTKGIGDRYFWAWKLIDFPNGTFQGATHGLARLLQAGLLPREFCEHRIMARIDEIFRGTSAAIRPNGSLEEAFPYENSFCVTGLVAFDLLCTLDLLRDRLSPETQKRYREIVAPMIGFLVRADETHAFISNHLATAAAALYRWAESRPGPAKTKADLLLARILAHQSTEGWFQEYEGADPGYQSLGTYYLADIALRESNLELLSALQRSVSFLEYCAHPDGSFGGLYGSRNTRFIVPAGIEALVPIVPEFGPLTSFAREAIAAKRVVSLATIDSPNLIPLWNAYCWAASCVNREPGRTAGSRDLPHQRPDRFQHRFAEAGLIITNTDTFYQIVSFHKGGVVAHFDKRNRRAQIDPGIVAVDNRRQVFSSQSYSRENQIIVEERSITITAELVKLHTALPGPWQFALLRIACGSVLRIPRLNALLKKLLVHFLITGKTRSHVQVQRTIACDESSAITDSFTGPESRYRLVADRAPFSAIHMASQGYWQIQDDAAPSTQP